MKKGGKRRVFFSFNNPKLEDKFDGENLSIRLANETADFIKQNKSSNFFAFLSFYAVHCVIQTTQEKWEKYRNKAEKQGLAENAFIMERKLPIRQVQDNPIYAGLVENMDDAVGIVLNTLKELNLDKNTIVIFTSDNGGVASGDSFSTSNLPFRGGKGYHWEGGIREPYFIYVPWNNAKIKSFDYPVTGADFYPTILDYANIDLNQNQHQDGISLKSLIDSNANLAERPLYWHYPHYGNQGGDPSSVIREGNWKLIHYYKNNSNELYQINQDPKEQNNVAENFPEITFKLSSKLKNWLVEVNALYLEKDEEFDVDKRKNYDAHIESTLLPQLEKERKEMLSPDFEPNKDWWGSNVTKY